MTGQPPRPDRDPPIRRGGCGRSLSQDIAGWFRRWLRVPEPNGLDVGEIKRLAMSPNDILVYRHPGTLSRSQAESLRGQLQATLEGRKILILDQGADFEVISPPPPPSSDD